MSAERIRPLRPYNPAEDAPEQNPIDKLVDKKARIDDLRLARNPVFERLETESLVVERVRGELAGASGFLLKEIEARLVDEASALLGPTFKAESYKPLDLFKDIGIEPIALENQPSQKETSKKKRPERRKRLEKSRGLNDPRPVEFTFPSGDKVRGKEGKIIKLLSKAKNRTLNKEQLFGQVYPGIKPQKAGELLNRSARSARKHALKNGKDIVATRDYEKKTTNYSLVDKPKGKKKR